MDLSPSDVACLVCLLGDDQEGQAQLESLLPLINDQASSTARLARFLIRITLQTARRHGWDDATTAEDWMGLTD